MSQTGAQTPLDRAHAAMEADADDDAARLRFFERLGDAELFLLLTEEARGENLSPELFDLADGRFVLVFDREERLAAFTGRPAPYAALSGRVLAAMLAGQGVGLGLNLDVAPSAMLIPAEALGWLSETLGHGPDQVEARITEVTAPGGLPEALLSALDAKLVTAAGLAQGAYLAGVVYQDGGRGHLLGFVDAREGAEPALAKAASEALTFSGIEAGAMDVGFFSAADPMAATLSRVGLRFDLPEPPEPPRGPAAPGMDPDAPPRLK
ncbi:SseB family protein [Ruegeria pomeroyi]|uniref:SseB family protein n=1 Tax=Ruegeria alba TaxID=2916756 RepID=A0ABS9NW09_9RHOB|nr:SseB family protein [Ruegeria alba]MCE8512984.1 SseB family protein [Ruegeria pomeroyi]MCE8521904.1 SseB family protein [Ruegeria pomeroyi]MCE8529552.1 SseB family protein [Ruegeria pomeroyi]MCG6558401.1 SseB family protein [Ruegeria alba]